MRIAMLGHKRIPSREGGVEVVVEELGSRMAELGHEVTCYNRRGSHVSGKKFNERALKQYRGMRLKWVPTIDIRGIAAMSASFFAAIAAAFGRYDVVHFHAEGPCAMLWLPKLFGKKCVATIHGLDHQRGKWGRFARAYIMLGEKCAAKFADAVIVLSKNNQEYFRKTYNRETVFIPNGVNRPEPFPADEIVHKYSLSKDSYILFLGRIVPEKGLHYLIEAFRNINTDKKLVIAGGASDSAGYYQKMKGLAAGDERVIFTDFVTGNVLKELYSNAYLYVLPSDLEGMPLSLLEAMSYGNCCLVSDIPEIAEVVQDKAVTFRHGDADDLREKLQQLCQQKRDVEKYRADVREYIFLRHGWDEVVLQTLALYGGV